jgi:Zn-dependent metalloprotease
MRIEKKAAKVPSKTSPERGRAGAAKSARRTPTAGLTSFTLDASDAKGRASFAVLKQTRPAFRGFAAGQKGAAVVARNLKQWDPETAALAHLEQALQSDALKSFTRPRIESAASQFKSLGCTSSPHTGTTFVKFRQMFNQIPVYGSLVTVELDGKNDCLAINSSIGTPAGVVHVATVSPAKALQAVTKATGHRAGVLQQTPRLYYYFDQNTQRWRLAYIVENVLRQSRKLPANGRYDAALKDYVVDAHSAKLLAELPRVATMAAVEETVTNALNKRCTITVESRAQGKREMHDGVLNVTTYGFDFKDPTRQSAQLPGTLYVKPPAPWPLEAISAHVNGAIVARFLRQVVKRNNIDNRGGEMVSSVNCWDRAEGTVPAREWKNAYWNGDQMVYGQILFPDKSFHSIAAMLDVVGHEMFHGVTDYTSRLEYQTQAGALNESYSDIFGTIIFNLGKPFGRWVWEIGKGFDGPGTALRSMSDPTLHDQPKHMRDFRVAKPPYTFDRNDYGYVHDNSGIHNYAAYKIMTAKLAGKYVFTPRQVAALFYIALTDQLSRTSQFTDSRRAVVQAARSLFRKMGATALAKRVKAVEDGFDAAGIA